MISKFKYIFKFIKSSLFSNGFYTSTSSQISKVAKKCLANISNMQRDDLNTENFESFIAHILGVFSYVVSYHESISFLSLAGHSLNGLTLLRSQLEAYLIFTYLINPKFDLNEIEKRVDRYRDWVMVKMYLNSKKSKNFELFTINPAHDPYLEQVEKNYLLVKEKYKDSPEIFRELEKSQSFLKNKREVARQCEIEELYLGIFTETSATVHLADISDRMISSESEDFDGYIYKFSSNTEAMMLSGISNTLLIRAISDYMEFFDLPKELKEKLF